MEWNDYDRPVQAVADVGGWDLTYSWMSSVEIGRSKSAQVGRYLEVEHGPVYQRQVGSAAPAPSA